MGTCYHLEGSPLENSKAAVYLPPRGEQMECGGLSVMWGEGRKGTNTAQSEL